LCPPGTFLFGHGPVIAYRLGFAVKVLGGGGLREADTRRRQSGPSLARSLEYLDAVFSYLRSVDVSVYRLSSGLVPYGTHPDLPLFDYRRQLEQCAPQLEVLAARARRDGLRLSAHPGQYVVLGTPDEALLSASLRDIEQDAAVLDALGQDLQARVVVHGGGRYGDGVAALERWARAAERLSPAARARLAVEHDERSFSLDDVLRLHEWTGVPVVFDLHHHRLKPAEGFEDTAAALAAATATWPAGQRPEVHVSSTRTEPVPSGGRAGGRQAERPPRLEQHAAYVTPWDLLEVLAAAPCPVDVMVEAKAKDLALVWLRRQLVRVAPSVAAAEERRRSA
jgi:UV DNA damage endonuclease